MLLRNLDNADFIGIVHATRPFVRFRFRYHHRLEKHHERVAEIPMQSGLSWSEGQEAQVTNLPPQNSKRVQTILNGTPPVHSQGHKQACATKIPTSPGQLWTSRDALQKALGLLLCSGVKDLI